MPPSTAQRQRDATVAAPDHAPAPSRPRRATNGSAPSAEHSTSFDFAVEDKAGFLAIMVRWAWPRESAFGVVLDVFYALSPSSPSTLDDVPAGCTHVTRAGRS